MKPKRNLGNKAVRALKRASPTMLSCFSAAGVVATVVLAVRATPKALRLIEAAEDHRHDDDPDFTGSPLTPMEVVKTTWKCYIPAAAMGAATIFCIFGANALNRKQQASLMSAYALVSRQFRDYKGKVKELYGKEAHERIMQSLAVEKAQKTHLIAPNIVNTSSLDFKGADEEERLFYDIFSDRYFQSTISRVLQAEYHVNRNFALMGGFVPLNQFYEFLGIEPKKEFSEFGWWVDDELYWIDFGHTRAMVDDGLNGEVECWIIEMDWLPTDKEPD